MWQKLDWLKPALGRATGHSNPNLFLSCFQNLFLKFFFIFKTSSQFGGEVDRCWHKTSASQFCYNSALVQREAHSNHNEMLTAKEGPFVYLVSKMKAGACLPCNCCQVEAILLSERFPMQLGETVTRQQPVPGPERSPMIDVRTFQLEPAAIAADTTGTAMPHWWGACAITASTSESSEREYWHLTTPALLAVSW